MLLLGLLCVPLLMCMTCVADDDSKDKHRYVFVVGEGAVILVFIQDTSDLCKFHSSFKSRALFLFLLMVLVCAPCLKFTPCLFEIS